MRLAIVSHKICYRTSPSLDTYCTDGGFPLQVCALSELFDETTLVVPVDRNENRTGLSQINGKNIAVKQLSRAANNGWVRKFLLPFWFAWNISTICKAVRHSDAVHTPIPGDIGTIGMMVALFMRKPLFVRHCGNWAERRTLAERMWRWMLEFFAGGRNVIFATGGANEPPSKVNPNIKWIFSTSLQEVELKAAKVRELPTNGEIRLMIACRQEPLKGTDIVIESLPAIVKEFPLAKLEIVGDGSLLSEFKQRSRELDIDHRITFHGRVPQPRVLEIMRGAHVFCFPTSASEGFPKVVLEALASGLPVITSMVSVLPELLKRGCGILMPEPSSDRLAKAVHQICRSEANYRAISLNAIQTAQDYSLENWRDTIGGHLKTAWGKVSLTSGLGS